MTKKNSVAVSIVGLYTAYFLCYLVKLSPSAIMPQLQVQLNLTSSQVGFISSMYFLPYALSQFFVGILCRRYTAHTVCGAGLFISLIGLLLFGYGNSVAALAIGRFFLGLGTAPFFIALVFYLQNCFEGAEYSRIYGYSIFVGNIASAIAAYPLQAVLRVCDRGTLCIAIGVISGLLGLVLVILSSHSGVSPIKEKTSGVFRQIGSDLVTIARSPLLLSGLLIWLIQCMCLMSYQGLWCVKWTAVAFPRLSDFSGLSGVFASLGVVLSGLFSERLSIYEPLVNRNSSRRAIVHSAGLVSLISVILVIVTRLLPDTILAFAVAMVADVVYGYAGGNIIVQVGIFVRESVSTDSNANIMGVFNGLGCLMQQLSQWLTGVGIDFFIIKSTASGAFRDTYIVVAALIALILVVTRKTLRK